MRIIGVLTMLFGIAFGIYAGLIWAFVGGIMDMISAIRAPEFAVFGFVTGVAKVLCSWIIGLMATIAGILTGFIVGNLG